MALAFYHRENIVGKKIKISLDGYYETFEIIGVVSSGGNLLQNFIGEYVPSFVYIPYSSMQKTLGQKGFDQIALKVTEETDIEVFTEQIVRQLDEKEGEDGIFRAQNIAQQKEKLNRIMQLVSQILSIIASISMVVAGLGIMTVMLAAVSERTKEIGIKKSIGATKVDIVREFLIESRLYLAGKFSRSSDGAGNRWLGCQVLKNDFLFESGSVLFTILFAVANGLVFGVYPSCKAANLKPVDALRHDI